MRVTWDERKRLRVLRERGVDLRRAALILDEDELFTVEDTRHDYGEKRYIAVGQFEGESFTIVYTLRKDDETAEDTVHIITAWRSGRKPRHRLAKRVL